MKRKWLLLALGLAFLPTGAGAVDGVVEINSAVAAQGGVTPGDTPGLPVTLSRSGSYRLTGDLLTNNLAQRVVDVTAPRVSLDLNGFQIGQCVAGGLCGIGSTAAIRAAVDTFEIRNGIVRGSAATCISVGSRAVLSDLRIENCGTGIQAGFNSRISGVTVSGSNFQGVSLARGSLLRDSVIEGSEGFGILVNQSALIIDTVIQGNDGAIGASGFFASTEGGYQGCVITLNDGNNEVQPIASLMSNLGQNVCGSDTICP